MNIRNKSKSRVQVFLKKKKRKLQFPNLKSLYGVKAYDETVPKDTIQYLKTKTSIFNIFMYSKKYIYFKPKRLTIKHNKHLYCQQTVNKYIYKKNQWIFFILNIVV